MNRRRSAIGALPASEGLAADIAARCAPQLIKDLETYLSEAS